ncbi:minor tail protein [Arthrobacter phage DrYang]|uniref:Minor tail protein n=1 Tax=Arthrobacter phage DrYang TaxID=2686080 RepID=A0A6B9J7K5_9CAUD|nr:minor tail protein [Arthrobacter phage DrYang]QGZ17125.1 minor tail protein [Arthrobacter phage DrYang]
MNRSALAQAARKPNRTEAPDKVASFYRGIVAEVRSDGMLWVVVPRLAGDTPIGPMPAASYALNVGERVMVGAVEDSRSDLMIICREYGDSSAFPAFEGVHLATAPTGPDHATRKDYVDALGDISANPNTVARRGASGSILAQEVYLSGLQTANNAATRKSYVDAGDAARLPKNPTLLPQIAHDLNDYQTPDVMHQSYNAAANVSANYPVPLAGLLEVFSPSTSFIYQRYTSYSNLSRVFWRAKYSTGAWGAWKEVQDVAAFTTALAGKSDVGHTHAAADVTSGVFAAARLPAATGAVQGAMSAADKTKLDAASAAATPSTLVMLDVNGRAQVAAPSATGDIANKSYVDTQVGTRALTAHTHAAADVTSGVFAASLLPAATTSAQGAMSAADKTKLDAANISNTGSTLALRTSTGDLMATNFFMPNGQAQSTLPQSLTRKDYVDTAVAAKANTSHTHTYADITGTVPTAALPPLAVNDVFPVDSQAEMLALTAQRGDMAIRSDNGRSYVLSVDAPGTLANWKEVMAAGQVQSVAGKTGVVALVKGDVGLGNVDNTSDANKPVSTATQTALNGKSNTGHTHLWADLTDKPATFTPSAHTHNASDINAGTLAAARLPAATSATAGSMSAADKAKLDAASAAATANTLVLLDASGRAQVATPAVAADIANKSYADTKAALSHTHAAADVTSGTFAAARLPLVTTSANGAMSAADKTAFDALSEDTGWVNVPLTSPWVNYDTGLHATAQVRRIGQRVELKAFLKSGSLGTNVGIIPAGTGPGFRPVSQRWGTATFQATNIGSTFSVVYPDGTVYLSGTGAVTYVSIEMSWFVG